MITIASTTYTVDLPNPTFGNTFGAAVRLFLRRTLSDKQKTTISTSLEQILNFTIENISIQQKKDFEEVLSESDELMILTNYDSQDWEGYITNFPFDFVETKTKSRLEVCIQYLIDQSLEDEPISSMERRYSCTINFRGIKI